MADLQQPLALDSQLGARQGRGRERTAWAILAIVLLFSIAAPLNQFKVPPIMPLLMGAFSFPWARQGYSCRCTPSPGCSWLCPRA